MCGVCGKAFSSLNAANKHEDQHIREVVRGLGWRAGGAGGVNQYSNTDYRQDRKTFGFHHDIDVNSVGRMDMGEASADPILSYGDDKDESLLLSNNMKQAVVLADEGLVDVCCKAEKFILTEAEKEAELELKLLSSDKAYYDLIAERALTRQQNPASRFRSEGKTVLSKVQNKFVDAYQLMKEGDPQGQSSDQYNKRRSGQDDSGHISKHNENTLYVNVMVRNSVSVVNNELERLARRRWEDITAKSEKGNKFERFRAIAHGNLVKLAGLALASDFTPRRIAVQLSNDLYRLLKPKMKRRGVTIETEIEYRVGPYFVLAVNITSIDWGKLIKATHKDVLLREERWATQKQQKALEDGKGEPVEKGGLGKIQTFCAMFRHFSRLTKFDMIARVLAWLYSCHWIIYLAFCYFHYYTFMGSTVRAFIISSVTEEIFYYVEEKGMEMEIEVRKAKRQTAFMLSALRELRSDDRKLKKKQHESETAEEGAILGPLLGPAVKADKEPASIPPGFEMPDNLEDVGLELDLPVGFRRLRWAMLSSGSEFLKEAVGRKACKYDEYVVVLGVVLCGLRYRDWVLFAS